MSLDGPTAKVARAREHAETLNTELRRFLETKPYRTVYEIDPDNGDHVWCMKVDRSPPMRLSIMVGDVIHNLRSSLDHLVWQLSLLTTPTPYKRAEFPIYGVKFDAKSYECFDKRGRQKMRNVPGPAQEIIESVQPYHGRDWPDLVFALIHEIDNADKHRIVLVPAPVVVYFNVPVVAFQREGPMLPVGLRLIPREHDRYEVFRLSRSFVLSPEQKDKIQFAYQIAIETSETGRRSNESVIDMVNRMIFTVDGFLPDFERFFTEPFRALCGPGF